MKKGRKGKQVNRYARYYLSIIHNIRIELLGLDEVVKVVRLGRIMITAILARVAVHEMPQGHACDSSKPRRNERPDERVLLKHVVEKRHAPYEREVVGGLVGNGQGAVKVAALVEIAEGLAEADIADNVPCDCITNQYEDFGSGP